MGFNCLKATATSRRQFTFYNSVPRNSWYSFYRPRKDERLGRPWSHPVVLNTGPLDWESSTLTTWPLLHCLHLDSFNIPVKPLRTALAFLSIKGLTQIYLVKTSMTHKYLTPQFLEDNNTISAKSATQISSLNQALDFLLLSFLITGWCNS